jgi:hypothetical protein
MIGQPQVTASTWEQFSLCSSVNPDTGKRYDPRLWDVPEADDPHRAERRRLNAVGRTLCRTRCPVLSWCTHATAELVATGKVVDGTVRAGCNQRDRARTPKKRTTTAAEDPQ